MRTVRQAADAWGVGVARVHQWIREGRVAARKIGSVWIVEQTDAPERKARGRKKKRPSPG